MPNEEKLKASTARWDELPAEITTDILQRLGTIDIVESAQRVCSSWWKVCHDPAMWHVIHLKYEPATDRMSRVLEKICRIAVDRSQGQLLELSIHNFGSRDLLNYIAERAIQLRHLRLVKCFRNFAGGLAAAAKNFPLLEELHIYCTFITKEDIESIGRSCSLLKSFILNSSAYNELGFRLPLEDEGQALAIARSMPELRHLALVDNALTNVGLEAILDGCPHLESLDLRRCYNIDLEGDLGRRCRQQIVDLKQPCASTDDYEFSSHANASHYFSSSRMMATETIVHLMMKMKAGNFIVMP
ncbi:hypothetical protein HAX54_042976 [Datura stramonium]|uniref:F-box domain-containing protein n=1 Tax=Datura stramonium TaxID=4076 RepID=A0ABS8SMP9_DATST|nr:hypothetical protein [Datura stramonium]